MKHVFMFDPKSFYNQQWKMDGVLDHIGQYFRTQEKPDFSIQFSRNRRDSIGIINDEAEKAKPGDIVRIYAVGGEEILFDCLNGVAHFPNMELASIPHGEMNDFLCIFGMDKIDTFRDIQSIVRGAAIPTDIINWGINYSLNSCHIGMNSAFAKKLQELKTRMSKRSYFLFSKFSSFFSYLGTAFDKKITAQKYSITVDDKDYSGQYSLIHVANGPYYAGKKTGASKAMPNDGLLDVALIRSGGALKTMWSMRKYSHGKCPSNCILMQAKKISIKSEKHMWIQLDNEYIHDTSIDISVVSRAVQMVAVDNLSYQKS
jgi:diacylglycerol kinase family enzyme